MRLKDCHHCGARVALRPDGVWVHKATRAKHCSDGPVPRPTAAPSMAAERGLAGAPG